MKILITERQFDLIMESGEMVKPYPIKQTDIDFNTIKGAFDVTSDDGEILDTIHIELHIESFPTFRLPEIGCKANTNALTISFRSYEKRYKKTNLNKQYKIISTIIYFIKKNIKNWGHADLIFFSTEGSTEKERRQKELFYKSYFRHSEDYRLVDSKIKNILPVEASAIHKDLYSCIMDKVDNPHKIIEDYIKNGSLGDLNLSDTNIRSLGPLEIVNGNLILNNCQLLEDFGNLKKVAGYVKITNSNILENLGQLKEIDQYASFENCIGLKNINSLKEIGSFIEIVNSPYIKNLGNVYVGSHLKIEDCDSLEYLNIANNVIDGPLTIKNCESFKSPGKIQNVMGDVHFDNCNSLENLGKIDVCYRNVHLMNLPKLQNLGNLKIVKRSLNIQNCKILNDMSSLESVGNITIHNSPLEGLNIDEKYPQLKGKY